MNDTIVTIENVTVERFLMSKSKCVVCGKEFERERKSKTTCSNACRKKLSRRRIAKKHAVSDRVESILRVMADLDRMAKISEFGDMDYEVMTAFKTISEYADKRLDDTSLVWECIECGTIKYQTLPVASGCYCELSQWRLQKKLL